MSYDTLQFYNTAFAIVVGLGAAALAFLLLPPVAPAWRPPAPGSSASGSAPRSNRPNPLGSARLSEPGVRPPLRIAGCGRATATRAACGSTLGWTEIIQQVARVLDLLRFRRRPCGRTPCPGRPGSRFEAHCRGANPGRAPDAQQNSGPVGEADSTRLLFRGRNADFANDQASPSFSGKP